MSVRVASSTTSRPHERDVSSRCPKATYTDIGAFTVMKTKRDTSRELAEYQAEETFHRREWHAQRIGWACLALLLMAGGVGLFGNGALAHRTISTHEGELQIDRFARRDAPTLWVIKLGADAVPEGIDFKLRISSALLQRVKIEAITPAPRDQAATANAILFTFHYLAPNAQIVFHVEPQHVGWVQGDVQLGDSTPVKVRQFVYP
jgi:hypothetical protein